MGLITTDTLRRFFERQPSVPFRVDDIVDSGDAWYVGQVALHKTEPLFRFGYWVGLSDSARFHIKPFDFPQLGLAGAAIVFRQFDSSPYLDEPEELLAGWVPADRIEPAEAMVALMNERLAAMLAVKHERERNTPPQ